MLGSKEVPDESPELGAVPSPPLSLDEETRPGAPPEVPTGGKASSPGLELSHAGSASTDTAINERNQSIHGMCRTGRQWFQTGLSEPLTLGPSALRERRGFGTQPSHFERRHEGGQAP